MKTNRLTFLTAVGVAGALLFSLLPAKAEDQSATEKALRKLDEEWSAAAQAKDLDKTVSFYAENAIVMPPNSPVLTTSDAVRKGWKEMIETPGAGISWRSTKVEVAKSGDLAYVTGTYEETMDGSSGKSVSDKGKYLEVFKKQADGSWKCVADMWNSDLASAAPEAKT